MEENTKLEQSLWEPLEREEKDAEKIERPSLTFFQDGWQRLRKNKIAMVSMVVIILITLIAIFVPMFWEYSYADQNLAMANLPPVMKVYPLNEKTNLYVTPQYSVVELDAKGKLLALTEPTRKDMAMKKNFYEIEGKSLVVDYSLYSKAALEYKKLEKESKSKGSELVSGNKAAYLKAYYKDAAPEQIELSQAKNILENHTPRIALLYDGQELVQSKELRNQTYLMGTDNLGRDLFIRIIYGARISLTVGIFAAFINFVVGVFYGGIAGYFGGRVDNIMMRIVDTIDSIPMTLYVILIMVIVGPGLSSIILALGLTFWVKMARIVRGQVLTLKQQEFIKAAIVVGADTKRIMIKHLIPNMMGPIMVAIAMQIPSAIFNEAFLSFVGLGVSAPQASWGTLCNDALPGIYVYPYQMFLPAIAIAVTILTFNLFSDGLRDAFDPTLRK